MLSVAEPLPPEMFPFGAKTEVMLGATPEILSVTVPVNPNSGCTEIV
jgi:hypothetical protein